MKVGRVEVHHHWVTTVVLDILLVLVLAAWYSEVTSDAPHYPVASEGQVYEMPVPIGHITGGYGKRAITATTFGPGYVTLATLVIGWTVILNTALLMLGIMVSFFKVLWDPPPSASRD
ncbi:MAG TPA: hypothetical protein VG407_15310 [Caulobacteraceae bacterium]|jgi:hypothetical protein|nr:hypothetical protein [Caulobacteraceae bacterium]